MTLEWHREIYNNPEKLELWHTAKNGMKIYTIYSFIENENMNAEIQSSIMRYHSDRKKDEIIYFRKKNETGFLEFLSNWLRREIEKSKKELEDII